MELVMEKILEFYKKCQLFNLYFCDQFRDVSTYYIIIGPPLLTNIPNYILNVNKYVEVNVIDF